MGWEDILDAFTSIDDKLEKTNKKLDDLINLVRALLGKTPVPVPTPTPPTPVTLPHKIISIPERVIPAQPKTIPVYVDKDVDYTIENDLIVITPDGDDIYISTIDTTTAAENVYKLADGQTIIAYMKGAKLHFKSINTNAKVRIWGFNFA